jgi:hypothetical protein
LSWLLQLEESEVKFEHLSGRKSKNIVAEALLCLDIDSLKIQEGKEELLSRSENRSISNTK